MSQNDNRLFPTGPEVALPVSGAETYNGMAFDGEYYYFTVNNEAEVVVLDCELCVVKTCRTRRCYTALCYDSERCCFWAASDKCCCMLFKLDGCLREIDCITLESCIGFITDISFCCDCARLLISAGNKLIEIDPSDCAVRTVREERSDTLILAVGCLPPFIVYYMLRDCKAYFVITNSCGERLAEECAPKFISVRSILLDFYICDKEGKSLIMLAHKHGKYPYLFCVPLRREMACRLFDCNSECAERGKKRCRGKRACADIIESIALQEAALAHILNAEGEKLQKIISEESDPCAILKTNESVQKTIVYATHLEQLLYDKLESVKGICDFKREEA